MEIATATATASTIAPQAPTPAAHAKVSSDYETFLKMLTAQLQNQDPLNPMDSSDYAVQLATFSSVEQQTKTNDLLESLTAQFNAFGLSQMASWVGQEARVTGPVWMDATPVALSPEPSADATRAVLVVTDQAGNLMAREEIPAGTAPYLWLGADAAGNRLPTGHYTLALESYKDETLLQSQPIQFYQKVTEVRGGPGGTTLVLEGGAEVPTGAVTALRNASR